MKTQEEINEFNRKCAVFLGYKEDVVNGRAVVRIPNKNWSQWSNQIQDYVVDDWYAFHSLKFHSDWNWIHEVIEAIEKLNLNVRITRSCITIENGIGCNLDINTIYKFHSIEGEFETKKEATVEAINEFLTWYKQRK